MSWSSHLFSLSLFTQATAFTLYLALALHPYLGVASSQQARANPFGIVSMRLHQIDPALTALELIQLVMDFPAPSFLAKAAGKP